ncbi:MAG: hypothetical protein BSOLF_1710 [Candidatus Carbobacillus altaicus]|uniref:Uncharacterized protein n=1 Tax=Candidatus Carbonibacillus altaicus TaxID=2163959 RepID=A0A2R6XZ30_9BACL|nr:MAG: hypothetical protein BSOLF_1710 [Candidatus Carbobacillus altaicus]
MFFLGYLKREENDRIVLLPSILRWLDYFVGTEPALAERGI